MDYGEGILMEWKCISSCSLRLTVLVLGVNLRYTIIRPSKEQYYENTLFLKLMLKKKKKKKDEMVTLMCHLN